MLFPPTTRFITGAVVCVSVFACAGPFDFPEPDLVPEATAGIDGPVGFCTRDANGLTVRVRNQTNNDVFVQTTTRVTFLPSNIVVDRTTAAMPGGSFADAGPFPIPGSCFNPDCSFKIEVDATDLVDESHGSGPDNHETNNMALGRCIG